MYFLTDGKEEILITMLFIVHLSVIIVPWSPCLLFLAPHKNTSEFTESIIRIRVKVQPAMYILQMRCYAKRQSVDDVVVIMR